MNIPSHRYPLPQRTVLPRRFSRLSQYVQAMQKQMVKAGALRSHQTPHSSASHETLLSRQFN